MGQARRPFDADIADLARAATRAPMLESTHEWDLARRWRNDRDGKALATLIRSYLRLVIAMAARFRAYNLPMADLVQEGCIGLMEAAARFDPDRALRFSTYASWWVRASMQDYVLRNWSIVRTGTTAAQKSLFFNLRRMRARIAGDTGLENEGPMSTVMRSRIAEQLGVRPRDVEAMEARLSGGDRSLNAPMTEDGEGSWQDFLAADDPQPDEAVETEHDDAVRVAVLQDAMTRLTARERTILESRMLRDDSLTLAALGDRMGISKERVRQLEAQALAKLRHSIVQQVGCPVQAGLISGVSPLSG
ncbi:MAG: RNA polymerase factor sigma-32 [Sphingomonadales bacterium]|nr:MAG: RNA polymerase factor sigma-32 [Sphingomonadales bacterium]